MMRENTRETNVRGTEMINSITTSALLQRRIFWQIVISGVYALPECICSEGHVLRECTTITHGQPTEHSVEDTHFSLTGSVSVAILWRKHAHPTTKMALIY